MRGQTVLVTRAEEQAEGLAGALRAKGAVVVFAPVIEVVAPADPGPLARAIADISTYEMVLFTSRNAVVRFFAARAEMTAPGDRGESAAVPRGWRPVPPSALPPVPLPALPPVAAIGAGTADAVAGRATVALVSAVGRGEAFADAVIAHFGDVTGRRLLVPQAAEARGVLAARLRDAGAAVDCVEAYRIGLLGPESAVSLEGVGALTFLSGRTLDGFFSVYGDAAPELLAARVVAVIGPVTEAAAKNRGVRVDVVAASASAESLVESLAAALNGA